MIFDVGFVFALAHKGWAASLKEDFAVEEADISRLMNGAETAMAGRRFTSGDLAASIAAQLRDRLDDEAEAAAQRVVDVYVDPRYASFDEAMIQLTRDLGAADVRVGMLTNGPADYEKANLAPILERGHVDALVLSGRDGVGKPDPAAFDLLLERLGVAAADACFIDDQARHAQAAEGLGIASFVYGGDAISVRDWLRAEGIPLLT